TRISPIPRPGECSDGVSVTVKTTPLRGRLRRALTVTGAPHTTASTEEAPEEDARADLGRDMQETTRQAVPPNHENITVRRRVTYQIPAARWHARHYASTTQRRPGGTL